MKPTRIISMDYVWTCARMVLSEGTIPCSNAMTNGRALAILIKKMLGLEATYVVEHFCTCILCCMRSLVLTWAVSYLVRCLWPCMHHPISVCCAQCILPTSTVSNGGVHWSATHNAWSALVPSMPYSVQACHCLPIESLVHLCVVVMLPCLQIRLPIMFD
jgi:hypothetical protein